MERGLKNVEGSVEVQANEIGYYHRFGFGFPEIRNEEGLNQHKH